MVAEQPNDPVLRNREHQRRSRARRKDYISELETRIRKYEAEGIKVTVEMQTAARRAHDENHQLRALLAAHGVPDATVDAHLAMTLQASTHRSNTTSQMPLPPVPPFKTALQPQIAPARSGATRAKQAPHKVAKPNPTRAPSPVARDPMAAAALSAATDTSEVGVRGLTALASPNTPAMEPSIAVTQSSPATVAHLELDPTISPHLERIDPEHTFEGGRDHIMNDDIDEDDTPAMFFDQAPTTPIDDVHPVVVATSHHRPDEIDCERAARIIASMRGNDDVESLRPELGCSTDRTCMVKNLKIFQLA